MVTELRNAVHTVLKNEASNLILADRDIDDKSSTNLKVWKQLCSALIGNRALRKLDLSDNNIGDAGVSMLAGALKVNTGLKRLDLSGNDEIDDKGAVEMANALKKNRSLTYLNLSHSQVGDEGARAFAGVFECNKILQTLNLSSCLIHSAGAESMVLGLEKNSTLLSLNLEDNPGLPSAWHERTQRMLTQEARAERRKLRRASLGSGGQDDEPSDPAMSPSVPTPPKIWSGSPESSEVHNASPWLSSEICAELMDAYQKNGKRKIGVFDNTAQRGISVQQLVNLQGLIQSALQGDDIIDTEAPNSCPSKGKPLVWECLTMYQVNDYFTKPLTQPFKCSWVEFIARDRQPPQWMISHAWSTPFAYTVSMVSMHARSRSADQWQSSAYWCCTFANNQHDLSELDEQDIMATPFARVLLSYQCLGTLLLCDPEVTPLKRVWCVFEAHITAQLQSGLLAQKGWHLFDVAVPVINSSPHHTGFKVTLLQDAGNGNFLERSEIPGIFFPLEVAHVGTEVDIVNAEASRIEDRNCILNYVATQIRSRATPPLENANYQQLNTFIHRTFASAELYRLACQRPADLSGVGRLLELQGDPTRFVRNGNTAIHAAVGADPSTHNDNLSNSAELLGMLLKAGSDPNVVNSQLCTALDYASQLPENIRAELCPILEDFGAKPFGEVASQIEKDMNKLLHDIVARGFESEGKAFGGRTLGDTDTWLKWPARHALQRVATNLCLHPRGTCCISIQEGYHGGMTAGDIAKVRAKAEQRGDAVLRSLHSAGCPIAIKIGTARQDMLLSISFSFEESTTANLVAGPTLASKEFAWHGSLPPPLPSRNASTVVIKRRPPTKHSQDRSSSMTRVRCEAPEGYAGNKFLVHGSRFSVHGHNAMCLPRCLARSSSMPLPSFKQTSVCDSGHSSPWHGRKHSPIRKELPDFCMIPSGPQEAESPSPMRRGSQSPLTSHINGEPVCHSTAPIVYRLGADGVLATSPFQRRKPRSHGIDAAMVGSSPTNCSSPSLLPFHTRKTSSDGFSGIDQAWDSQGRATCKPSGLRMSQSVSDGFSRSRSPSMTIAPRMSRLVPAAMGHRTFIEVSGLSLRGPLRAPPGDMEDHRTAPLSEKNVNQ
jgi:hypothetical protein